jgi:rod shape-determining protein MreC
VLVALSIALMTIYFREPASGGLHQVQSAGATVLHPFEVAAERVARPFRDLYGYFAGLVHAKSQRDKLRHEVDTLRQQALQNDAAAQENKRLKSLLQFRDTSNLKDYKQVSARVIAYPPSEFEQEIVVSAGSGAGIRVHDPVVTADGLVGDVTKVTSDTSLVTLLTDSTSAVSALDPHTGDRGTIRRGQATGNQLVLDRVPVAGTIVRGEGIVTAGTRDPKLPSLYPRGIPIGVVTRVGQSDVDLFKRIQVQPYVDFGSLDAVLILVSKKPPLRLP